MQEELKQAIDKRLDSIHQSNIINRDWFYNFFNVLTDVGYKGDLDEVLDLVLKNPDSILNNDAKEPLRYIHNFLPCKKRGDALLNFLRNKLEEQSPEQAQAMLDEMFSFIKKNSTDQTFFGNLLVKYLSLKYSNELKVQVDNPGLKNTEEDLVVFVKLGDFAVGCAESTYYDNELGLSLHEIRTLKELTGQRIGSVMMQETFRFVNENYPEQQDLVVQNVIRNNVGAQRFYARLGCEFYTPNGQPIAIEDIKTLPEHSHVNAIYDKADIKNLSEAEDVKPLSFDEYLERHRDEEENENQ